ncbi:MAG: ATP-binding protein [Thermoleophilaceae bacterium]
MRLPRGLRGRLTVVLATGSVLLVAGLIAGFNLVLRSQIDNDLNARLRERASAALANVVVRGDEVVVREAPGDQAIDQQVWVFARGHAVESPNEPARADAAAAAAAVKPDTFRDLDALDLRLYAHPLSRRGRTLGAVVAGGSLGPYETTARRALVASIVLGILILAGVLVAVRLAITAALRPVDRMTAEAAAWSVDDLDHRFADAGAHDELSRLGATFNDLLARLAASFRHEQLFSAEVSHELRTPLAKLIVEAELALRRERTQSEYRAALESVVGDARQMQRVMETLLAVARSEIDPRAGTSDAAAVAESVVESLQGPLRDGIEIELHPATLALRLGVDAELAQRVLAPVVANALRFAAQRASVELRHTDSTVEFIVADDGPGVPPEQREAIFAPGFRGAPPTRTPDAHAGIGLGLALARRLARAAGGDVVCDGGSTAAFVVSLPSA